MFQAQLASFEGLMVLMVVAFTVATWWLQSRRHNRLTSLLEVLAQDLGGTVHKGGWGKPPTLEFSLAGAPARLQFREQGRYDELKFTDLVLEQPRGVLADLHVYPERLLGRLARSFGAQDVQLGDPFFDDAFMVKAKPPEAAHQALDERVRLALQELLGLGQSAHVDLSVSRNKGRLRLRKQGWLKTADLLARYLELGGQVLVDVTRALGGELHPQPDEPAASPRPENSTLPHCPVCQLAVEEQPRVCRRCGARHHPECWQLNDGCGACRPSGHVGSLA